VSAGQGVLTARGLTKRYAHVTAVRDLNLEVRAGEVYGFLGRNGAGKTTTIRMLLGLIRPTAGEVRVLGTPMGPGANGVLGRVGYLVETATAYGNLTVRENLELHRRLHGAPEGAVAEAIDHLGLGEYADRRADTLSLGNKQRLSLARALLHAPDVLILDEPANGLDPAGIVEVRQLLRGLADDGVTVFMSSHILSEVGQLADRIGLIHEGRLLEELDREALRARARPYIEVRVDDAERARTVLAGAGFEGVEAPGVRSTPGLHESAGPEANAPSPGRRLRVFDADGRAPEIARRLVGAGVAVEALVPAREDLEAYFLRRTGGGP
jgi:ABC-2 type transport system ATP-binding protein